MNPKTVKKALKDAIQAMTDYKWLFLQIPAERRSHSEMSGVPIPT